MGSVPIYLGAPNVNVFSPGDNSYIDIRDYESPESLAKKIQEYCDNESLFNTLLEWKKQPLKNSFKCLIKEQKQHPFVRLAELINRFKINNI